MNIKLFLLFVLIVLLSKQAILLAGEGHDAGYEWAAQNDITDEFHCDGKSDSFNEGCRQYVEENEKLEEEE